MTLNACDNSKWRRIESRETRRKTRFLLLSFNISEQNGNWDTAWLHIILIKLIAHSYVNDILINEWNNTEEMSENKSLLLFLRTRENKKYPKIPNWLDWIVHECSGHHNTTASGDANVLTKMVANELIWVVHTGDRTNDNQFKIKIPTPFNSAWVCVFDVCACVEYSHANEPTGAYI